MQIQLKKHIWRASPGARPRHANNNCDKHVTWILSRKWQDSPNAETNSCESNAIICQINWATLRTDLSYDHRFYFFFSTQRMPNVRRHVESRPVAMRTFIGVEPHLKKLRIPRYPNTRWAREVIWMSRVYAGMEIYSSSFLQRSRSMQNGSLQYLCNLIQGNFPLPWPYGRKGKYPTQTILAFSIGQNQWQKRWFPNLKTWRQRVYTLICPKKRRQ